MLELPNIAPLTPGDRGTDPQHRQSAAVLCPQIMLARLTISYFRAFTGAPKPNHGDNHLIWSLRERLR